MKKLSIILCSLIWITPVFSVDIYDVIDEKIETVQKWILEKNENPETIISTIEKLIQISKKYENQYPGYREIFNYISQDFKIFLSEYKQSIWYINTLISVGENWEISNLEVFQREFNYEGNSYFVLRKFIQNNREKYLIVEDKTYKTEVILASDIIDFSIFGELYENSEYKKHQDKIYNYNPNINSPLQNNGIIELKWWKEVFLTADFCPSGKHGFEKQIIEQFITDGHINIWIAITSTWIAWHSEDYEWLREKNNSGDLNISWINHTKTHNYNYGVDFSQNFILTPWLELQDEILDLEEKLLEQWQVPSIFMRYPGLVSDDETRKETIYTYGLIPLGANAWLAKGEIPEPGSIILIHGNKNEHYWVELMHDVLDEKQFEYWEIESILK